MVQYDPAIIQKSADYLYLRAKWITVSSGVMGFLVGVISGFLATAIAHAQRGNQSSFALFFCPLLGLLFGIMYGRYRSFALKLQAQLALCQTRVEENTRQTKGSERVA